MNTYLIDRESTKKRRADKWVPPKGAEIYNSNFIKILFF